MKNCLYVLLVVLTLVGCAKKPTQQSADEQTQEQSQDQMTDNIVYTDITALTPAGEELSLSQLVGQTDYVLLDFWASWCRPCRRFIPVLKEIYVGQPEGHLQILSCSVDQDVMAWQAALNEEQMPWPQMREDANHVCSDKYGVQYIPFTVLIDREGHIVALNPEEPQLEEILLRE